MIGAFVTFQYATDFDEKKLQSIAEGAQHKFVGMPGLRSKAFTIDVENRRAVNFYVWESREAATGFFTPQLAEGVTALYGVRPDIRLVSVAAVVDNAHPASTVGAA
jgi:hypothetical protein